MKYRVYFVIILISYSVSLNPKESLNKSIAEVKKNLEKHEKTLFEANRRKIEPIKITDITQVNIVPQAVPKKGKSAPKMISPDLIQSWAQDIYTSLNNIEKRVVRDKEILKGFYDIKSKVRNGTVIVNKVAESLQELLMRRVKAAENIMRKAEELAADAESPPDSYTFDDSVDLNQVKKKINRLDLGDYEIPMNCTSLNKLQLSDSKHFNASVSLDTTSVYVTAEVFECAPHVSKAIYWSRELLSIFKHNYAQDASTEFQYFCSYRGFLRHYPAALWRSMYKLHMETDDVYDCRLRPWYVSAAGAPRDVLILLDASGSMTNSSNNVVAEQFILALLSALTDDDQVNVLRFNLEINVESPIVCFNEKLVPANHVNSAAMMAAMKFQKMKNETHMNNVLKYAIKLLQKQETTKERPPSCQQAIVLLADSMYNNYTELMRQLDPQNRIRLFTLWLHDRYGLRDNTRAYADWLSCDRDGYFAELITNNDVTEQVIKILQVLERPLVAQRKERLRVFSDVYAHVEDPRRSEYYWKQTENKEQAHRYTELRANKEKLLSPERMYKDHMYQVYYDKYGYYYEGQDLNYRLEITVAVPVFDSTLLDNITKQLDEEKLRNSTRTYPVNRLLGVAGVDIPIDHLKLVLPYHEVGAGGSLFIVDHRGNIVLHDNVKPTFDGFILKPGYRTVDFLDLEQAAVSHHPRHYPSDWLQFRKTLLIDKTEGNATMFGKDIFDGGMRAILESREYHWKRVLDQYTVVIVLPSNGRHYAIPETAFTKQLAEQAWRSLSKTEYAVHPDWLYCQHVEPHFDSREAEVRHFIRRRSDEPNFKMRNLKHLFSPIPPALLEKTYQCDMELMAKFCKEVIATDKWANEHEEKDTDRDCSNCELGSITAFFASESGLTRWQQYHATSSHPDPPNGAWWPLGPSEPWYRRAASQPGNLIIHSPVLPIRKMRNTFVKPPRFHEKLKWLTAARTLGSPGTIGVAGYHFYHSHLVDLLDKVTNFPCAEDGDKCEARCDGIVWTCMLVDEGGWIVAREKSDNELEQEEDEMVSEHLAILYPGVMAALLNASVFELNWLHDYQSVCFTPIDEKPTSSTPMMPSLVRSIFHSVHLIVSVAQELATFLMLMSSAIKVSAETENEKQKRKNRTIHDYRRELFDNLYDERVLVNRTRFAACDRSRPLYVLQNTPKAIQMLKRAPKPCRWPLVGAFVPKTNLILLAVFNNCSYHGRYIPNPLHNEQYLEVDTTKKGIYETSATRLACWRNRVPLPTRPTHMHCYPHNYTQEKGYRQCGPWLPDPENASTVQHGFTPCLFASIILLGLNTIIV